VNHFDQDFSFGIRQNFFELIISHLFNLGWLGVDVFFVLSGF